MIIKSGIPPFGVVNKVFEQKLKEIKMSLGDENNIESFQVTKHKQIKHEGIRLPCNLCDFTATRAAHLREHKRNKHEGVR